MANPWATITVLSSLVIRGCTYIFLRWIPGHHFPPIILYTLITYLISFAITSKETLPYEIVADEVDFVVVEPKEERDRAPLLPSRSTRSKSLANGAAEEEEEQDEEVELDIIEETIVLEEKNPQILKTLLWGLPSPTSPLWSLITLTINIVSVLFVADMIYRGPVLYPSHGVSFARVGYVSDNSANILIREPNTTNLPIYISYRKVLASPVVQTEWRSAGQVYWLSEETDFTSPLTITHLQPSTPYQYCISNNHTGTFTTAPLPGQTDPHTNKFTFLTSSCIKPQFPYFPFRHPLTIPGLNHLAAWLPSLHAAFMLFLGDFIYIDVPRRFGTDAETYRREYRQVYASPSWPAVSASLPWLHVMDDHEIANDWDRGTSAPYPAALDPFTLYHASVNPPPPATADPHANATYYAFTHGPAAFFLLDTRRYRTPASSPPAPASPARSMLGPAQLAALLAWLQAPAPRGVHWKFVVSSVPFTRNWRFGSQDTWAGYLHERQTVLEAMWDATAEGGASVVVLSGDRHEFAATRFAAPAVMEFSTSPLGMFDLPVRTYVEVSGEGEECVAYVPDGNSKFGAVEVETLKGGEQSVLRFRLFVDGVEGWGYSLLHSEGGGGGARRGKGRGRGKDAVWG